jgi:Kef-type K+ transport system membrane component KefB
MLAREVSKLRWQTKILPSLISTLLVWTLVAPTATWLNLRQLHHATSNLLAAQITVFTIGLGFVLLLWLLSLPFDIPNFDSTIKDRLFYLIGRVLIGPIAILIIAFTGYSPPKSDVLWLILAGTATAALSLCLFSTWMAAKRRRATT